MLTRAMPFAVCSGLFGGALWSGAGATARARG